MHAFKPLKIREATVKQLGGLRIQGATAAKRRVVAVAFGTEFVLLFAFWVLISGHFQFKYLLIGVAACALVTYLTNDLLYDPRSGRGFISGAGYTFSCTWRLIEYIPWLVWAIIKANIQVAVIILKPKMPIDPGFLQFKTELRKKVALVTLANSITLTPGTITVDLTRNKYIVHAIVRGAASDLESGLMQNKAAAIFCDCQAPAPNCSWACSREELDK